MDYENYILDALEMVMAGLTAEGFQEVRPDA